MVKTGREAPNSALRAIPSVERILSGGGFAPLVAEFGRERAKQALVEHLSTVRALRSSFDETEAVASVRDLLAASTGSTLRRIINGSGVIIHTNLGRAPIHPSIWSEAAEIVQGYSNLEFELESGERGAREEHLTALCQSLFGC